MKRTRLNEGWRFVVGAPGAELCADIADADFRPASTPGTLGADLLRHGDFDLHAPRDLDASDALYERRLCGYGAHRLIFDGLSSGAQIYLDGALIGQSQGFYEPCILDTFLSGDHVLRIRFPALAHQLRGLSGKRARWRPRMIQPAELRLLRTSALGHMPGFAPPVPPVGIYRDVWLESCDRPIVNAFRIASRFEDGVGRLTVEIDFAEPPARAPRATCGDVEFLMRPRSPTSYVGALRLTEVEPWTPHTHGAPRLYDLNIRCDDEIALQKRIGFRAFEIDRGADGDGFGLRVNGEKIFCRGAVWTPLDVIGLQSAPDQLAQAIALAVAAGVNMFRVAGPFGYECDAFYEACDSAGILVWQDFAFANFDYPIADEQFRAAVEREATRFLSRTQASPCIAVLCGGSEVYQQAAMLGLPEERWRSELFTALLPQIVADLRPDAVFVENSPSGGALPFQSDKGVSHYYGVGAYRRGLDDARRAHVRFASECLGFSNIPDARSLAEDFGAAPLAHPLWDQRIPKDQGAEQNFAEVRDHYVSAFYACDAQALKASDPARYLDYGRAAVAEAIEATLCEWRCKHSSNAGALVWFWKDLWASTGWGVIDWRGRPKSAWHGMRRALQPVQLVLTDEGVNGAHLHCINERATPFSGRVELLCYRDGATVVMQAERAIEIAPRDILLLRDSALIGGFFDTTYAYRFGPPSHQAVLARLWNNEGALVSSAWLFPLGRAAALYQPTLTCEIIEEDGLALRLSTDVLAQSVRIEDERATPAENWVHLAPGAPRVIRFFGAPQSLKGRIAALGGAPVFYNSEG